MVKAKTVDPVEEARERLDQAQRDRDAAAAKMDEFKTSILEGVRDVSPKDYGDAAHELEHAELLVQAAALAVQAAERDARQARLVGLKAEVIEQVGTPEEALADWQTLVEVCGRIVARSKARRSMIGQAAKRMRRDGVPRHSDRTAPADEHAGCGWAEARMGYSDTLNIDGRTIQDLEPGMIIASAARAGARKNGVTYLRLTDNDALAKDPEHWFRAHY